MQLILETSIVVEFSWKPENRLLLATIHNDTDNIFINNLVAFGALLILNASLVHSHFSEEEVEIKNKRSP